MFIVEANKVYKHFWSFAFVGVKTAECMGP